MALSVPLSASPILKAAQLSKGRSRFVFFMIALAFVALLARALYLQGLSTEFLQAQGESRYARTLTLPAVRGKITDRNGVILAASVPARAIWAIPDDVKATPEQLKALATLLGQPESELKRRLSQEDRTFVYLRRQVPLETAEKIAALKIPGIHQLAETRRQYPVGESVAHVVGFTNVEDRGQEGIELALNEVLSGVPGNRRVIRDRYGRIVEDMRDIVPPRDGGLVTLAMDSRIQFLVHSELKAAVQRHRAKAAAAVVLDVRTGEVLALANIPDFNPNDRTGLTGAQLRNRVITDTFEPGSTIKPFTVALGLELKRIRPETQFDTGNGRITITGSTISDSKPFGVLDTTGVVKKSSNVGTTLIAQKMQPIEMWRMFHEVGLGQAPRLGFPGEVAGRVRPHERWRPVEQATMSYGYGLSTSLVQLARAYTVFARDGDLIPLSLTRRDTEPEGVPVFSPEVARKVRDMLEAAAGPEGTAPRGQVAGYRVAGKTGTARKLENGRYTTRYVASFVGFAPVSDPRIVVAVMVDEPTGVFYGGQVAAPVFSQVVGGSLRILGITPDAPFQSLIIPDQPVQESL